MAYLEKRILENIELLLAFGGEILMIYFFTWEYGEDSLKQFIETLNAFYPTIKFTAKCLREEIDF